MTFAYTFATHYTSNGQPSFGSRPGAAVFINRDAAPVGRVWEHMRDHCDMTRICRAIAAAIPTLLVLLPAGPSAQPVGKYAVFFGSCTVPGDSAPCMAMRSFARSGRRFLLT